MKHTYRGLYCLLLAAMVSMSCNKGDDDDGMQPEPEQPKITYQFYVSGKMDGKDFYWKMDTTNYKMAMAPYNSRNVSLNNNYIRYGTSIVPATPAQVPYLGVEFSGFLGNALDKVNPIVFQNYFKIGNYNFGTMANRDTAVGINIFYEKDANYTNMHESSRVVQPPSSYFTIDSVSFVKTPTTHAYIKARFSAVLKNNNGTDPDITITDGVFRVFIHNSLEE